MSGVSQFNKELGTVNYIFVTEHPNEIESEVNDKIREGYIPIGGPLVLWTLTNQWGRTKTEVVAQAMVKRDQE